MIAFAFVGVTPRGLSVLGLNMSVTEPAYWYKWVFSKVVGFWVAWGSVLLALVSTAGLFPDLMAGGAIDLYVSKPISRLRLFVTKYAAGLLFTSLQVVVFAIGSVLVFGLRGGEWRPAIFLMVPVVVLLYSYLFAVAVLLGVLTRSTIASLLLTIIVWLVFFMVGFVERQMFDARIQQAYMASVYKEDLRAADARLAEMKASPGLIDRLTNGKNRVQKRRDEAARGLSEADDTLQQIVKWHRVVYTVGLFVPKTGETVDLFNRRLFTDEDLKYRADFDKEKLRALMGAKSDEDVLSRLEMAKDAEVESQRAQRSRSIAWILGTSLGFEAVVIAIAAWVFCRRDY
jgi:ABC-type multidrug transport system fused ATPase/permease subunit